MFKWKPEERASLEQVMRHPWLEGRIVPGVKRESKGLLAELAGRLLGWVTGIFRFGVGLIRSMLWVRNN
jgi:hypothetical protein